VNNFDVTYHPQKKLYSDNVNNIFIQPKPTISIPNDPSKTEANAIANKVMRIPQTFIQTKPLPINSVQRKCAHCEEEKKAQRKEINGNESTADHTLESYVSNLNGSGQSLSKEVRNFYEPRFGYDFSNVKVHTDSVAAKSAQSINALAYTSGNNIVFNYGNYAPGADSGKQLLAHELTHVVQQKDANSRIARQHAPVANPKIEIRYGLGMRGRYGLYDAELNRRTNTLTLLVRVRFTFSGAWASAADRHRWQTEFINTVQNRWSYRYYLVPDGVCPGGNQTFFARINVIPVAAGEHYSVNVAHTATNQTSSTDSRNRTASLDSLDNQSRTRRSGGVDFQQRASEHEFGHMLGLPHIECGVNDSVCPRRTYGNTVDENSDVMGRGWTISERDYYPFITALYYFTGCNWRASHRRNN